MAGRQTLRTFECAVSPPGEDDVSGGQSRVLVVEDDLDHAELVQRTLERQSFAVTVVGDGFACLQAVETTAYSVILLDYSLPRVNGLEVLAELRKREISVPIVMVAGQGEEHLAIEVIKAGGMDFVVKTSGYFEALPTVLHKVLEQYALARENRSLHQETERRLRDAEALVELARTLTSTLDLKALINQIGQAAARACGMERCTIFAYQDGCARPLISQFADGRVDHDLLRALQAAESRWVEELPFLAETLQRRDAVVMNGLGPDALFRSSTIPVSARALLTLPLLRQDTVTGALVLDRSTNAEPVTASQIIHGTMVARHVALALENANLHAETQRAMTELVTELKEAQDPLVRGETLRTLRELASGAAHQLNNLLAIISGRAQLLLRTVDQGTVRRPLEIIDRASRDGAEVVCRIQQFIRQHDGDLSIASAVEQGTTAAIRRPPMIEPGAVLAPTRRVSTGSRLRVLLIDDELDVRETLAEQLEAEGFLVHQAADAVDAIAQLERGAAVDLVVTDHGMPGTTGAELARIIKHRWPHLPVGLVTGWSEVMSSAPTIEQGVDFVLGKPVSIERLLDAIVLVCGSAPGRGPASEVLRTGQSDRDGG
jgi:DNA-binding response OmpR family regulator/GAF domain-containing protein